MITAGNFSNIVNDYNGISDILNTNLTDSSIPEKWFSLANKYPSGTDTSGLSSVAYMLDNNVWSTYKNSVYADYAIGGPTIEMIIESYNNKHPHKNIAYSIPSANGYKIGENGNSDAGIVHSLVACDSTYFIESSIAYGYWIAGTRSGYSGNLFEASQGGDFRSDRT